MRRRDVALRETDERDGRGPAEPNVGGELDERMRVVVAVALLMYVRLVIHRALLAEGAAHEIGPDAPCPECHRIVPTMAFCPACGVARAAAKPTRMHEHPRI